MESNSSTTGFPNLDDGTSLDDFSTARAVILRLIFVAERRYCLDPFLHSGFL